MLSALLQRTTQATIGGRFRDICVVGLNRVELMLSGESEPVFGNHWEDLTDDKTRKSMALLFFAPRELDGTPQNPYQFLSEDDNDLDAQTMTEQDLQGVPLLDMNRMPPADPGHLNIMVAADILFHWDSQGSYVLPTNKYTWVRDIRQLLKEFPKNIEVTLYTNWDVDQANELNIQSRPLYRMPLYPEIWLNTPTFQEKYGTYLLLASVALIALTWGTLHLQGQKMDKIDESIRITQQKIPREGRFIELNRYMAEQERFMQYREMFPWLIADVAYAIEKSNMKFENFEVGNATPQEPSQVLVATIEATKNAYKGWLQEEPISKAVLLNSTSLAAIRKPPGNTFKLEGLIPLRPAFKEFTTTRKVLGEEEQATISGSKPLSTTSSRPEGGTAQ